jgi:cellulose synthase/poly-beta-1,6-N-acetylglucosamine synthase-like glycosyltransferase
MVKQADASNIAVQYICEPQKGLSKARNAGLAQAKGEFILFTDDDVLPSEDWAEQLVVPLNDGTYDAVTGRVSLSPALKRHWQTPMHNAWMAINDASVTSEAPVLIGANMGFHRRVLESVPLFDPELGVGALGVAEETLFGWQLLEAGFKIGYVPLAKVLHEPNSTRLARHSWLTDAKNRGQTEAYIRHHWRHEKIFAPRTRWLWLSMIFWVRSFLHPKLPLESEGCQAWEMSYLWRAEMYRCFVVERQRPRNYSRRGLVKNVPDEE